MKIGICLTGVSHQDGMRGRHHRKINYDCCPTNIYQQVINPLRENNEVNLYLTTYQHDYVSKLSEFYRPTKFQLLNYNYSSMQNTYAKGLEQLRGENLDFVISTRFDIIFHNNIKELKLDYDKMNILFEEKGWKHKNYTCDCFYAFSFHLLEEFITSVYELPSIDGNGLHGAFNHFRNKVGEENTKILDPNPALGRNNPYYYLPSVVREGFNVDGSEQGM